LAFGFPRSNNFSARTGTHPASRDSNSLPAFPEKFFSLGCAAMGVRLPLMFRRGQSVFPAGCPAPCICTQIDSAGDCVSPVCFSPNPETVRGENLPPIDYTSWRIINIIIFY